MPAKSFDLDGIGTIFVYKRRGSRNLRLSVNTDGKIRVTMPAWLPYKAAVAFAQQKQNWLSQQQFNQLVDGQRIGKYHTLVMEPKLSQSGIKSRLHLTEARLSYPSNISKSEVQSAAHKLAQKALRQQADQLLPQKIATLAQLNGLKYSSLKIRHLKTRWGSCSSKHQITLNYYLMQLPWELIDYVLIHELVHTKHLNHSSEFWKEVETIMPDYKQRRKQLKQFQPSLLTAKA